MVYEKTPEHVIRVVTDTKRVSGLDEGCGESLQQEIIKEAFEISEESQSELSRMAANILASRARKLSMLLLKFSGGLPIS